MKETINLSEEVYNYFKELAKDNMLNIDTQLVFILTEYAKNNKMEKDNIVNLNNNSKAIINLLKFVKPSEERKIDL